MKKVGIVMGSDSDLPVIEKAVKVLRELDIPFEAHVFSAHRTPDEAREFAAGAREAGFGVILAAAGMAAHLAGAIAANTTLPVIGIPCKGPALDGLDALLSTVQMPSGIPVACVGIGNGANAALLAAEILAVGDAELAERLAKKRAALRASDIKSITQSCQIHQAHIILRTGQGIRKSCPIHIQINPILITYISESLQFCFCIKRSILCWMGQINHSGHYHMFMVLVTVEIFKIFFHIYGRYLSVLMRDCKNFMPVCFDGARFVYTDMPGPSSNDSLIRFQQGIDHNGIRLCSSCQKLHSGIFTLTGFPDPVPGGIRDLVKPVPGCFHQVGFHHSPHNGGMRSFSIITGKAEFFIHVSYSLSV